MKNSLFLILLSLIVWGRVNAQVDVIATIAGTGTIGYSGDGGAATAAQLDINYMWSDAAGNIYFIDQTHNVIRKINTSNIISTIAGTGSRGYSTDGTAATAAALWIPAYSAITTDASGNIYYVDFDSTVGSKVRKINTSGVISTIAGGGTGGDGGPATAAALITPPSALSVDASGNIYLGAGGYYASYHYLRKINTSGIISTISSTAIAQATGDGSGNIYFTDGDNSVKKCNTSGAITTLSGVIGYAEPIAFGGIGDYGDGGPAIDAGVSTPDGIAIDGSGNIYFNDANAVIRKINTSGIISTIAGLNDGATPGGGDCGEATAAGVPWSGPLSIDGSGNLYFCGGSAMIRKLTHVIDAITGTTAVCGTGVSSTLSNGTSGGTWSSSDPSVATISTTGVVTSVSVGSATISYSLPYTCSGTTATYSSRVAFTVNAAVPSTPASISGTTSLCTGGYASLADATPGGTWSSSNAGIVYAGLVTGGITGVSSGSATITYTVTNGCGSAYTTYGVSVVTVPSAPASITGTTTVCTGATTTLSDATAGGAWSSSATSTASVNASTGVVYGVAAGSATITYTVSNACGSAIATTAVTVNTVPDAPASITGITTVCQAATTTLADATGGGTWSSSAPATASVSSGGVVRGNASGSATISYTLTNSCGATSATAAVTVNPLPNAGTISGASSVCKGLTITLSSSGDAGGTWSSSAATNATVNSSTGVVTGTYGADITYQSGTATISYTVTNGCGTARATKVVTANDNFLSVTPFVCDQSGTRLVDAKPIGGTWAVASGSTGTISVGGTATVGVWAEATVTSMSAGTSSTLSVAAQYTSTVGCTSSKSLSVFSAPYPAVTAAYSNLTSSGNDLITVGDASGSYGSLCGGTNPIVYVTDVSLGTSSSTTGGACTVNPYITNHSTVYATRDYTSYGCGVRTSSSITITVGGMKDANTVYGNNVNEETDKIKVYPNPNSGLFTLELPVSNRDAAVVTIMDISGKVIFSQSVTESKIDFDFTDYARGTYILHVTQGAKRYHEKITVSY